MSEQSDRVPESITHWRTYSRLCAAPLPFAKPFHMILRTFRLHSMLFHTLPNHFRPVLQLFQHAFIDITSQPLGRRIRDVPTFQIWCPHIYTPSGMSITVFRCPSASIPFHMILNLFYFRFIYSILYILHTLIFKNTSSHFATQYRIAQRNYLSSLEHSPLRNKSYFALIRLARTRSRSHSLRIHSPSRSLNRIHSPTSEITFYT